MTPEEAVGHALVALRSYRDAAPKHETADEAFACKVVAILEALKLLDKEGSP
jgi:hypothetical protein